MISRRQVVMAVAASVLTRPFTAFAQNRSRVFRVGWVALSNPGVPSPALESFRRGLTELGYVEGRNIVLDARLAGGSRERAHTMVLELVQAKTDVIVTQGGAAMELPTSVELAVTSRPHGASVSRSRSRYSRDPIASSNETLVLMPLLKRRIAAAGGRRRQAAEATCG